VTIKDADGREWVLVPKDGDWNMTKAALALITSSNINTGDLTIGTLAAAFENAIAATPQFVPPAVTDEVGQRAIAVLARLPKSAAHVGCDMITAVQQVLGPTLGLAPQSIDVDWLSNVIRTVDGNHSLGAGALAEKIAEAINARGVK